MIGENQNSDGSRKPDVLTSGVSPKDPRYGRCVVHALRKVLLDCWYLKPTTNNTVKRGQYLGGDEQSPTAYVSSCSLAPMRAGVITPPEMDRKVERKSGKHSQLRYRTH